MIDIASYENNGDSFAKFQSDLLTCLGDSVFASSTVDLCLHLIRCIKYDFKYSPESHQEDVLRGCQDIKQNFVNKFGVWEEKIIHYETPTVYQLFILNLLDFETLPAHELLKLERDIKGDLDKRNETISFYQEAKYIQEYKAEGIAPRNQEEKTLHAFYIRNIEEQQKILEHFLYKTKSRAIIKSKNSIGSSTYFLNSFYDRPYLTSLPNGEMYFDHRKIDLVGHRLLSVLVMDAREFKGLYSTEKEKFYEKLLAVFPFDSVISNINYYLQKLNPLSDTRRELFEELIELFKAGKYYGFYSLALSQVEGLFSEMLTKINPKLSKVSLPDKVRALRPSHKNSERHFDYYEYFIPTQRNKFMHSGLDDNIKIKSYDLIFDLMHILSIYVSLDSPIIKLTQIVKRRDSDTYFNEEGFNEYFRLVEDSKRHADFGKLENDIKAFEKDFLSTHIDIEYFATELEELVPKAIESLIDKIKHFTKYKADSELNLDYWTEHSIKTKPQELLSQIRDVYEANQDDFLVIENYKYFIEKSLIHLPNMSENAKKIIAHLKVKFKTDLTKITMINELMQKALNE